MNSHVSPSTSLPAAAALLPLARLWAGGLESGPSRAAGRAPPSDGRRSRLMMLGLKGCPWPRADMGPSTSSSVSCRCSAVVPPRRTRSHAWARCMGFSSSLGVSPALQAQGLSALRRTDQGLLSGGQVQRQWKTTTCPPGRALFWTIGGGAPAPRSARRSAARSGCSATRAGTRSGGSAGCGSGTRTARGRAGRAARRWAASRSPRGGRTGGRAYRGAARGSGEA